MVGSTAACGVRSALDAGTPGGAGAGAAGGLSGATGGLGAAGVGGGPGGAGGSAAGVGSGAVGGLGNTGAEAGAGITGAGGALGGAGDLAGAAGAEGGAGSGTSGASGHPAGTGGETGACVHGQTVCIDELGARRCVDTTSDPLNCGACDTRCEASLSCVEGRCTSCGVGLSLPAVYRVGSEARRPVLGDLNRDGALDAIVLDRASGAASVLLGEGDGSFREAAVVDAGDWPEEAALADLNRDGALDLIAIGESHLYFALGAADGTFFQPRRRPHRLDPPLFLAVGDVDADGLVDAIGAGTDADDPASGLLFGFFGHAEAGLLPATELGPLTGAMEIQLLPGVGGTLDIHAARVDEALRLRGRGDRTFGPPEVVCDTASHAVDLTGDGVLDYVSWSSFIIQVALGQDGGGCTPLPDYRPDASFYTHATPVIGDVTNDGIVDMIVRLIRVGRVVALHGIGDGTFAEPSYVSVMGAEPAGQALGDLDADGWLDLFSVGASPRLGHGGPGAATVALNRGDGTFEGPLVVSTPPTSRAAAGDFDADGGLELVAMTGTFADAVITILKASDTGYMELTRAEIATGQYFIELLDVDGDGALDVLTAGLNQANLLLGDGTGALAAPIRVDLAGPVSGLAAGDVSSDDVSDVIVSVPGGPAVLLGDGTGQLSMGPVVPETAGAVALGDLNGDGLLDLVLGGDPETTGEEGVGVCLGYGDGTFGPAERYAAGGLEGRVRLGDIDGDGALDVVVGGELGYGVLLGDGGGRLMGWASYPVDQALWVELGDISGDGVLDVVTGPNGLGVHAGRGDGTFAGSVSYPVHGAPFIADYDGDGMADVIVADYEGGGLWLLPGVRRCE